MRKSGRRMYTPAMRAMPILSAAAAVLLSSCTPYTESERAYFEAREVESVERKELQMTLVESAQKGDVIRLVSEKAAPDGQGAMRDWLEARTAKAQGQVLFPKWDVLRRGSNKYEVQYTFMVIDRDNKLAKQGYAWNVDVLLRLVSPPRELPRVEVASRTLQEDAAEKRARRIQEEEASLE